MWSNPNVVNNNGFINNSSREKPHFLEKEWIENWVVMIFDHQKALSTSWEVKQQGRRQNSWLPAVCASPPLYHTPFHVFTEVRNFLVTDAGWNEYAQSCSDQKLGIPCNEQKQKAEKIGKILKKSVCHICCWAVDEMFFQGFFILW